MKHTHKIGENTLNENKINGQHLNHMKRLLKESRATLNKCHNYEIEAYNNEEVQNIIVKIDDFLGGSK